MSALDQAARWRAAAPRLSALPWLEAGAALLIVLLYSQALLGKLFAPEGGGDAPVLRLIWPPVYLLTLGLIAGRPARVLLLATRAWPILFLVGLAGVSVLWSIDPEITARRALAVAMNTAFALWLAARFSWGDIARLVAAAFAVLAAGSLLAAVLAPGFGVMQSIHPGAWSGLWFEKNSLGGMMALGALAAAAASANAPQRERAAWRMLAALCLVLVVLSTSRTAMMAAMIGVGGPVMIAIARRGFDFAAAAITAAATALLLFGAILVTGPGAFLEAIGRDPTLTGRTEIWQALARAVAERPWTGFGYAAFWEVESGPAFWIRQETAWDVPTAHNAWLEIALGLGLPATAVAAVIYLRALGLALSGLFSGAAAYWALPFLAMWGLVSVSESNLLGQNTLSWVLFAATAAKLSDRP